MNGDPKFQEQLAELAAQTKANGRLEMATEVLTWAKKHERGISDMAMTDLLKVCGVKRAPIKA